MSSSIFCLFDLVFIGIFIVSRIDVWFSVVCANHMFITAFVFDFLLSAMHFLVFCAFLNRIR